MFKKYGDSKVIKVFTREELENEQIKLAEEAEELTEKLDSSNKKTKNKQ